MNRLIAMFFMLILMSSTAFAGSVHGSGTVKKIYFHSLDSVIYDHWAGTLQLEIDSLSWNDATTECSTSSVGVRFKDTHIISAVLAAKMAGSTITVYANEDLRVAGSYCYVRAVGL